MKVTLAVEHDGNKPDSTIDVDDSIGRTLIAQGRARAVETPKSKQTKADQAVEKVTQATTEKVQNDTAAATVAG